MLSYSIKEWCQMHGVSHSLFYKLLKNGEAPVTFKIGRLTKISEEANRYWVAAREAERSHD